MIKPSGIFLLGALAILTACEGGKDEEPANEAAAATTPCAKRFEKALSAIAADGGAPRISMTFRLPDDPSAPLLRKLMAGDGGRKPNLRIVQGNSELAAKAFGDEPVRSNGELLLSDSANLYRVVLKGPTPAAAIESGCEMERQGMQILTLKVEFDPAEAAN